MLDYKEFTFITGISMEEILNNIQEVLGVPAFLINQCTFLPDYIKEALTTSINFVPWLYILYYGIELLERYILQRINLFVRLIKTFGPLFASVISTIPECGYQVIASTFYSRKMITRGTLLAFFISCSDDALPLLLLDFDWTKALVIIPIIAIKVITGVVVAYLVDIVFFLKKGTTEDINAINTDLNEPACCHHRITTIDNPPYWWMHPLTHTFNMFMFTFITLAIINCAIKGFGNTETLANFLLINSPYQVMAGAVFGLIPNCVTSVVLAIAFVKGLISFPTLLAGLITTTGLGLATLTKRQDNNKDNYLITFILLATGIAVGLFVYYNMQIIKMIQDYFVYIK